MWAFDGFASNDNRFVCYRYINRGTVFIICSDNFYLGFVVMNYYT